MIPYRILVTGDRNWTDVLYVCDVLSELRNENAVEVVIEGDAMGADKAAGQWATLAEVPLIICPADWDKYKRAAGPIRNTQMLKLRPNLVVGFHANIQQSKGTANMLHQSKVAGLKTILFAGRWRGATIICPGSVFFG